MEVSGTTAVVYAGLVSIVIALAWRVLNWVWFRPKSLERLLRRQGLSGNSYRFLFGDLKESSMMMKEAKSKPMNLSHDIAPRVLPYLHHTVKNFGQTCFIWVGPNPRVIITNPEDVKDTFAKYDHFQRPHSSNPLVKLLATGLANYEDEKWAKHRKILNPAFTIEKLKKMVPAVDACCSEMISKWEVLVSKEGSCELDVWPYLQNLSADVISRTAFGSSYQEGQKIFQLLTEQAQHVLKLVQSAYVNIPGWSFLPTKMNKRMKEIDKEIDASLKDIINERKKAMKKGDGTKDDLLGVLLDSNFKEIQQHGNKKSVGMSTKDVIEECKLFYFAGQETTSVLLVWTMVLLSMYPNWQHRAREEVLQAFGSNKPDFDGLTHLKVVQMILNEVLRLYPPVLTLDRKVRKKTQLGKLTLPAGGQISLAIPLVHHDKQLWGEDASEFNPERFSEGVSKATKGRVCFFPFGWGPRICIGQNFALVEAKMALSMILQNFTFDLSPSYAHAPASVTTLKPEFGAHIILHKRN